MTPTLQDIALLLGLFIDGQVVTFTSVCNQITLCDHVFRLAPPPFELKRGSIRLKWIENIFTTPLDDANDKVLRMYPLNYNLNMLIICYVYMN